MHSAVRREGMQRIASEARRFLAFALGAVWRHKKDSGQPITLCQTENRHTCPGKDQYLRNRSWWRLPKHSKPVGKVILWEAHALLMETASAPAPLKLILGKKRWVASRELYPTSVQVQSSVSSIWNLESWERRKERTQRQGWRALVGKNRQDRAIVRGKQFSHRAVSIGGKKKKKIKRILQDPKYTLQVWQRSGFAAKYTLGTS